MLFDWYLCCTIHVYCRAGQVWWYVFMLRYSINILTGEYPQLPQIASLTAVMGKLNMSLAEDVRLKTKEKSKSVYHLLPVSNLQWRWNNHTGTAQESTYLKLKSMLLGFFGFFKILFLVQALNFCVLSVWALKLGCRWKCIYLFLNTSTHANVSLPGFRAFLHLLPSSVQCIQVLGGKYLVWISNYCAATDKMLRYSSLFQ